MKSLSLIIQKIWPMLKFFADRQAKNYMPPIFPYGGIKIILYIVIYDTATLALSYSSKLEVHG
jgi:hypothetical protein